MYVAGGNFVIQGRGGFPSGGGTVIVRARVNVLALRKPYSSVQLLSVWYIIEMSTGSQKIVGLAVTASVQVSGLLKPANTDVSLACFSSAATPFVNRHRLYGRANTVLTWEAKSMGNGEFCLPPQNRNLWINCNKIWQNWLVREGNP